MILSRAQNGAAAAEFALVAPMFFMLLFGAAELGRALWTQVALQETAIAGARCVALPACASAGISYIQRVAGQWGLSLSSADISACFGMSDFSQVTLRSTFQSVVPTLIGISSGGLPLTATACFPNNP